MLTDIIQVRRCLRLSWRDSGHILSVFLVARTCIVVHIIRHKLPAEGQLYFNRFAPLPNVTAYSGSPSIRGICRIIATIEQFWSAKSRFLHILPVSCLIMEFTSSGLPHTDTSTGNRFALAEHLLGEVPVLRHSEEDETRRGVALLWLSPDRPADKHRPNVELRAGYLGVLFLCDCVMVLLF